MADTALQLGIVGAYMVVALAVGVVAYRLTDRSAEDYYLASRTLGTVVLLFTTFATLLSAFTFFGGPNLAFAAGPEWILVMGLMDGIIFAVLWYVLGYKQWLVGKRHGYVTLGEMLGDRFGSTPLRVLVAGVSLVWLFPYVMLQQKGAGQAIVGLTEGAVPFWVGAGGITLFMIVYVAASGMRGVAWTDTLQGLFMLSLVWVAVAWILAAVGGAGEATAALAETNPEFLALGGGLYSPQWMLSTAISIAFGVTMFPQINQRFFAAESKTVLKRTFALWPVLVLLLFVPAFMLGAWAAGLGVTVPEGSNVVPALLAQYTPTWFAALVIAGAMAAMMSSSDSMLLSGSSYLTRDVYRPLKRVFGEGETAAEDAREALVARIGVVAFATLSFVASLYTPGTLVQIGDTAFSGFAQLTVPVALALYWQGTTRYGMYAGIGGAQVFYVFHVFPVVETLAGVVGASVALPTAYAGWTPGIVGILLGLVLTVGVSLVTSTAPEEKPAVYRVDGVDAD
ncbi:sodium:solute symporter family protein [Haloarcula pellucida]|uniref:Sodium:solute symporter n=1 Tax=Haloarcula pellucida TaxID=1427151 RepID=A0A830GPZ0_9EURY|nr:sodium:solute symporter family protein [Halomicroarcula pellucida]MBX0348305.1 sodium:solute symporter family protein [Halomicroarcula pellucida]GGN97928.1 sodium:solute symporter [Halomicroarcula pellucida]